MKELAFIARVDDRERNEYIRKRLIMKVTDDQLERLKALLAEIWKNKIDDEGHFNIKPELFGADGQVTFEDRELQGQFSDEPEEDELVYRNNVSLMDYLTDYKGERHDRYSIAMDFTAYDEDGKQVESFPGFSNF